MNCPFSGKACPCHNKAGGCQLWMQANTSTNNVTGNLEGCAFVLQPLLQMHLINNTAMTVQNLSRVEAEISHARVEQIQNANAALLRTAVNNQILEVKE